MMDLVGIVSTPFKITKPKPETEGTIQNRIDRTLTKPKSKLPDSTMPLNPPDKHGVSTKARYGCAKNESSESDLPHGGTSNMTLRVSRGIGRATLSCYSESNSTQSTPTKSVVSKPPVSGYRNKFNGNGRMCGGNFAALYRGCLAILLVLWLLLRILLKFLTSTLRKIPLFRWITMYRFV